MKVPQETLDTWMRCARHIINVRGCCNFSCGHNHPHCPLSWSQCRPKYDESLTVTYNKRVQYAEQYIKDHWEDLL